MSFILTYIPEKIKESEQKSEDFRALHPDNNDKYIWLPDFNITEDEETKEISHFEIANKECTLLFNRIFDKELKEFKFKLKSDYYSFWQFGDELVKLGIGYWIARVSAKPYVTLRFIIPKFIYDAIQPYKQQLQLIDVIEIKTAEEIQDSIISEPFKQLDEILENGKPRVPENISRSKGKMEREYYKIIKEKLEQLLTTKNKNFHLEITADKKFSNKLKAEVNKYREIVFTFLKEAPPDIAGFIKKEYGVDFLVIEIKTATIKLDDIYQARKYAELFDAKYGLLVSTKEIPEEIKRLSRVVHSLRPKTLTFVHYNEESKEFIEWFPKNPFE